MSEEQQIVTAEGYTVAEAVLKAAEKLGIDSSLVEYKLDISHFRTEDGRSRPQDTVKIMARGRKQEDAAGALAAKEWIVGLLEHMGVEATVAMRVDGEKRGALRIDSPRAAHLVGRRGATLNSITLLLEAVLDRQGHGDWDIRIDIEGGRDDRDERQSRDDRDDRGGRRSRSRDDRDDRDDRDGRSRRKRDINKLKELARRLAQKVVDDGEEIAIRQELNSYERRIVHMELGEFEGVETESRGDGSHKQVVILPAGG